MARAEEARFEASCAPAVERMFSCHRGPDGQRRSSGAMFSREFLQSTDREVRPRSHASSTREHESRHAKAVRLAAGHQCRRAKVCLVVLGQGGAV
jgi:hypothetical protein